MDLAVLILIGLIAVGLLWLIFDRRNSSGAGEARLLQAQYESLRSELQSSLDSNLRLVSDTLSTVSAQMQSTTGQMNTRMDNAARAVGEVRQGLGELNKAAERIFDVGKDISSLQEILRSPKLRGGLGELLLGDLLCQCLPSAHYTLQHPFADGTRVDAVIRLKGGLVPIDAKFPLENFRKMAGADAAEKKAARRRFIADCRRHIDAIADLYIKPSEGTLSFALMYIPAENVYYETIIKDEELGDEKLLSSYAFSKRVIPVSPNSFYAYMQTILLGLRGMEVSDRAVAIISHLDTLRVDFERLSSDIATLGRHINNSRSKFEDVEKSAGRFGDRLVSADGRPRPLDEEGAGGAPAQDLKQSD